MPDDYELIIESENRIYKNFKMYDKVFIGVEKKDPFQIVFKNNTYNRVAVCFSVDGTDVLTGDPASTAPEGQKFIVNAHDKIVLKAWAESNESGSQFVFSTEDKSVAIHTHGKTNGLGIIAAAVFVDNDSSNYIFNNRQNYLYSQSYNSSRLLRSKSSKHVKIGEVYDTSDANLAVGAGEEIEQKLTKVAGLRSPVLDHVLEINYLPWSTLSKMLYKASKFSKNAFPGDKPEKRVNLKNVPKVRSKQQTEQRFV